MRHPRRSTTPRSTAPRACAFAAPAALMFAAALAAATPATSQEPSPTGFTEARAASQLVCEARFLELPRSDSFREHLRTITANPHPAGSEAQQRVGEYLAGAMERAGLEVERHPYDVYLPELTDDVEVHIVTPVSMQLSNREPALPEDRFSGHPDLLNGWNAYSGSGDVTAEVVYANFGRREDYLALDSMGVSVAGKVVIARYGGNFRGYKVLFAEERGAAGVVMFNDPGFSDIDAYPDGPMMNGQTIQRGSVLTLPWTGDPLTPFVPALPLDGDIQVERLDPSEVALHTIPVLPIGYEAATEILSRMTGRATPPGWSAGMELDYRLTGGPDLTVRVRVNQPRRLTRATNVVGTLRGSEFPDEWFILGAHYDPWGFGAIDPNGGTAMLLTLAEALGALARDEACRPRRSIMIAHWDAEEYGIIGSTEWVEHFREELEANAIAYINADGAVSGGRFGASSSPSLKGPIIEAVGRVAYPGEDGTILDWWLESTADEAEEPAMGNLGGGSDHVGFYTHAGVPSGALSSGNPGGVYHSNYDNFAWYERFGDTDFVFGPMIARADGILALRFANADVLPYDVARYASDTRTHVGTLNDVAQARALRVDFSALAESTRELDEAAAELVAARDALDRVRGRRPGRRRGREPGADRAGEGVAERPRAPGAPVEPLDLRLARPLQRVRLVDAAGAALRTGDQRPGRPSGMGAGVRGGGAGPRGAHAGGGGDDRAGGRVVACGGHGKEASCGLVSRTFVA